MRLNKLLQSALMAGIIALGAYISIPVTAGIPFTMQIFFIFITVLLLEPLYSFYSVAVYLTLGIAGLPVFSGGRAGIGVFFGPAGGFLAGFLIFPLCCLIFRKKNIKLLLFSFTLFYFAGITHMSFVLTIKFFNAFKMVFLFILLDLIKLAGAYYFSKKIKKNLSDSKRILND